ncbi:MAG TPA: type I-U CRISPR-associated protein Csb2 [Gammaproteobacteria bacterium]|nr:type I-U CRISPR-associated protein Csb2 [Gammaproteobacteria bacterium]
MLRDSVQGQASRMDHSSALVQMGLVGADERGGLTGAPDDARAIVHLRIPAAGTLEDLERQHNAADSEDFAALEVAEMQTSEPKLRKKSRKPLKELYGNQPLPLQRPRLTLYHGYARPVRETAAIRAAESVFTPHPLMLQLSAKQGPYRVLDLATTLLVTHRWREAILSHSNGLSEPVRRMLSGHDASGAPSSDPHLAFLPLAFVGHEHADGHLLGMGLALPAGVSRDERREVLRAIAAVRTLKLGRLGVWDIAPVTAARPPWNLRAEAWTAHPEGATHWSSVTPIVFDRHPKAKDRARYQQEAAAMIAEACTRMGLPKPREVIVTQVSVHIGVPPAFAFPRLKRKDGSERQHTHAILVFDEPVYGPLLLGAGRFRGYGVCRPDIAPVGHRRLRTRPKVRPQAM